MRSVAGRYYEGIKIRTVAVPNQFGGPQTDDPRLVIRGLITPFRSEETFSGGRDKVVTDGLLYCDPDVVIKETDRIEDADGTKYSVVGLKPGMFGSHQLAYLERVT